MKFNQYKNEEFIRCDNEFKENNHKLGSEILQELKSRTFRKTAKLPIILTTFLFTYDHKSKYDVQRKRIKERREEKVYLPWGDIYSLTNQDMSLKTVLEIMKFLCVELDGKMYKNKKGTKWIIQIP